MKKRKLKMDKKNILRRKRYALKKKRELRMYQITNEGNYDEDGCLFCESDWK